MKKKTLTTTLLFSLQAILSTSTLPIAISVFASKSFSASDSKELLHFDFNDKNHLGMQIGPLPLGSVEGDAKASLDFPGAVNFGGSGFIMVPGFKSPKGAFSVETRFRLNEYALQDTRFITDLINTATWDSVVTNGFSLRVGGGNLYAALPESAYPTHADYLADIGWYNDGPDAALSKCIGEFVVAIKGEPGPWTEVVTDRCLDRKSWIHMVSVYDGTNMHIYLNGLYATDTLRIFNKGGVPNLNPVSTAFIGARTYGNWDARHLNGEMDFVRVVDSAMGPREIRERYRQTLNGTGNETICHGSVLPYYPNPGQAVNGETQFRCRLVVDGACTQPGFNPTLLATDSIEVEIASDFDFTKIMLRMVVKDLAFKLDAAKVLAIRDYKGGAYWRVRIKHAANTQALSKSASASFSDWSLSRPVIVDLKAGTVALNSGLTTQRAQSGHLLLLPGSHIDLAAKGNLRPRLWTLDGAEWNVKWVQELNNRWAARIPEGQGAKLAILSWE